MRKELCRNFQRGSCRYGEACRYLHPQQVKQPNNPFGFGSQSSNQQSSNQQQKSTNNPFGFGSQSSNQQSSNQQQKSTNNPFGFGVQGSGGGNRSNQFQNKWTRDAPNAGGGGASTQQTGKQTQPADHKCTDPVSCRRIMQEDFTKERPMWKLTCYGHWKHYPCDISGDISYEELRALAYDEAKRGIPLQSIVERERNLQKSKIAEFDNFLQNPYNGSATANQSLFAATTPSIFPPASQTNSHPAFSGFGQQSAFTNTSPGGVSLSGPPNPFGKFTQQPNAFSVNTPQPAPSGPSGFQNQPSVTFKPASFGPGPGFPTAPQNNNIFPSTTPKPGPFGPGPGFSTTPQNNSIFPSTTPTPAPNTSQNNQTPFNFNPPVATFTAPVAVINTSNTSSVTELKIDEAPVDSSIWLKEKWNPGEIPEQAPPDAFV